MVPISTAKISYNGNGVTTQWPYNFKIIDSSNIKVMIIDPTGTETVLTSDYYVDTEHNNVVYPGYAPGAVEPPEEQPPILPSGWSIVIYRELTIDQQSALDAHWPFQEIESMVDKNCMILQSLKEALDRTFKASIGNRSITDLTIPSLPGQLMRWNDEGSGIDGVDLQPYAFGRMAINDGGDLCVQYFGDSFKDNVTIDENGYLIFTTLN